MNIKKTNYVLTYVTTDRVSVRSMLYLLEHWILDEKGFGGAVLMGLSKVFDTLNHELLIAKLSPYGFNNESLKLIYFRWLIDGEETKVIVDGLSYYRVYPRISFRSPF